MSRGFAPGFGKNSRVHQEAGGHTTEETIPHLFLIGNVEEETSSKRAHFTLS